MSVNLKNFYDSKVRKEKNTTEKHDSAISQHNFKK